MENYIGRRVHRCLWARSYYWMLWRAHEAVLSPNIYLLYRLQRKVRTPLIVSYVADLRILRVLMTTIRSMGNCPCPRCTIKLSDVYLIGTKTDRKQRTKLQRVDDEKRQDAIRRSRQAIYKLNDPVDSAYVERQLKDSSLVPTSVRLSISIYHAMLNLHSPLECILRQAFTVWSWLFFHVSCGSAAWVGDWCLEIYFDAPSSYTTKRGWKYHQPVW